VESYFVPPGYRTGHCRRVRVGNAGDKTGLENTETITTHTLHCMHTTLPGFTPLSTACTPLSPACTLLSPACTPLSPACTPLSTACTHSMRCRKHIQSKTTDQLHTRASQMARYSLRKSSYHDPLKVHELFRRLDSQAAAALSAKP